MLTHKLLALLSCVVLLFSVSCKRQNITKTTVETNTATTTPVSRDTIIVTVTPMPEKTVDVPKKPEKIMVQVDKVDFNYLNIRSKLDFKDANNNQSASANFHIKKDSAIWFSIRILIVEGARGVITQDSIHFFALDSKTLKKNYYDLSLDSLSRKFNFKLDFGLLQSLLVGNMPIKMRDIDSVSANGNEFQIHQIEPPLQIDNFITSDNHKLKKLIAIPDSTGGKMTITYDNFLTINGLLFPQNDFAEVLSQKDGQPTSTTVNLQHTKVEFTNENPGFAFKKK